MIFIELVGGRARRLQLEFHPCMTIVDGFGPKQRWDMANRLARALRTSDIGFDVTVDVDGYPEVLDEAVVQRLGVGSSVDNVIGIEDIPGVQFYTDAGRFVPPDPSDPGGHLAAAHSEVRKATDILRAAEVRMESASRPAPKVDQEVLDQLAAKHNEVVVELGEARERLETEPLYRNSPEKKLERRNRLETIELVIDDRIKELRDHLAGEGGRFWSARAGDPDYAAHILKSWHEVTQSLAEAKPVMRPPRWLIDQVRKELKNARQVVQQFMVALGNGDDVFEDLEAARDELREVERQWSELQRASRDEIAELQTKRAELFEKAIGLAARELEFDEVEEVLEELAAQPRTAPERPLEEDDSAPLRRDLAAAVLDLRDVRRELAELDAEMLFDSDAEDEERVAVLIDQLKEVEERERELGERLAELTVASQQTRVANPKAYENARQQLAQAQDGLSNAQREFEHMQAKTPVVDPLKRRAYLFEDAGDGLEIDMSQVEPEKVKLYLLGRAAALRRAANGASVPLVIDAAFDELEQQTMFDCLNSLMQAASVMQIIYLAGDKAPVEWAKQQDEMRVAVTRMGVV